LIKNYILALDGKTPVEEPDIFKWATWFELSDRVVRQDRVGDYTVSTVFLGVDHNWWRSGKPVLWETMIFGGCGISLASEDIMQRRYRSYEEALAGHEKVLEGVKMAVRS
jgi:hypothetical protein